MIVVRETVKWLDIREKQRVDVDNDDDARRGENVGGDDGDGVGRRYDRIRKKKKDKKNS